MATDLGFVALLIASHAFLALVGYYAGVAVGRFTARTDEIQRQCNAIQEQAERVTEGSDVE